ncbi:MAG TPA: hypothetical protein VF219_00360, partial [Vicinamibacterales bacterium]
VYPHDSDWNELADFLDMVKKELKRGNNIFASPEILNNMLTLSKCPDLVVNKGHYFGTSLLGEEPPLSDADKRALIAVLKTF